MTSNTQSITLTDFLLARIADAQADAIELGATVRAHSPGAPAARRARNRLIRTEAAHRHIVLAARSYSPELAEGDNGESAFDEVLRILATSYADHPDYREEWRP